MLLHEIFREQQIANGRDDRRQQDADGFFALLQQTPDQRQRQFEIARGQCVA